mgnify:FL=1
MPVSIIPFNMPKPAEIPPHIIDSLKSMQPDEAIAKGMELLLQIEAADTVVYELIAAGQAEMNHVAGARADILSGVLEQDRECSFVDQVGDATSALLIMGQASADEESALPNGVLRFMLEGAESGMLGFTYVLPLKNDTGPLLGGLTLIRRAASGPLNHEQPNICEALRRELSQILAA